MAKFWSRGSVEEFEALPTRRPGTGGGPDPDWQEILDDLRAGEVVVIPFTDEEDMRSKRQHLNKRAANHEIPIDVRYAEGALHVRAKDRAIESAAERQPRERGGGQREGRGRRRRSDATLDAPTGGFAPTGGTASDPTGDLPTVTIERLPQ